MKGHSMITGLWGKKIGMTQIFDNDKTVPVTVIDLDCWLIINIKRKDRDRYDAIQVGHVKRKYAAETFSLRWLKELTKYFSHIKEIKVSDVSKDMKIGQPAEFYKLLKPGDFVDVTGTTKGCGFIGVVKRHGFAGPPGSHGSTMGNRPGSISFLRSQGKVIKGKKLPGHMGVQQRVTRGLQIVRIEPDSKLMLVKGSMPGKSGSLLFVKKA